MKLTQIAAAAALNAALLAAPTLAAQGSPALDEEAARPGMTGSSAETTTQPARPAPQGTVARTHFTLDVVDREPVDDVTRLENGHDRILFFTELHRFQGQELVHRWEFGGEVKAEVPFAVDGPRWRVYSSKALDPAWVGTWTVSVIDADGNEVARHSFDYVPSTEAASTPGTDPAVGSADTTKAGLAAESEKMQPGPAAAAE